MSETRLGVAPGGRNNGARRKCGESQGGCTRVRESGSVSLGEDARGGGVKWQGDVMRSKEGAWGSTKGHGKAGGGYAGKHKSDVTRLGKDAGGCTSCREV